MKSLEIMHESRSCDWKKYRHHACFLSEES